jgi:Transposase DDE domain
MTLQQELAQPYEHTYLLQQRVPRSSIALILSFANRVKLGVKRSTNQEQPDGSTKEKKELIWGYGSGVAAATTPDYGDVVLAEYTQPFNEGDVTSFRPLYQQAVGALEQFPTHLTADAAFDAWYVYECAVRHAGIAAVPLNSHASRSGSRDSDGVPICPKGLRMLPTIQFAHTYGYRAQRFLCPLLHPEPTGGSCEHAQFAKGKGCVKDLHWELGGLQRVLLDRSTPLYKAVYTQRTCCERINSQAKELGIERPKVRNRRSVANLTTLIYVIINVRALHRAKSINRGLLQMS